MAQQILNNGESGLTIRTKINEMTEELYNKGEFLINLTDYSIPNDGTNEVATTDGINSALQDAYNLGYSEVALPAGVYLIDAVVLNPNNASDKGIIIPDGIVFDGRNQAILKVKANESPAYRVVNMDYSVNSMLKNFTIIGDKDSKDFKYKREFESGSYSDVTGKAIEHARQQNIEMGYLTEVQQWNREKYEEQARKLNQLTRIKNARNKAR